MKMEINDLKKKVEELQQQIEDKQIELYNANVELEDAKKEAAESRNDRLQDFLNEYLSQDFVLDEDIREEPYSNFYPVDYYTNKVSVNMFGVYERKNSDSLCEIGNWNDAHPEEKRVVIQLTVHHLMIEDLLKKYDLE